MRRRHILIGTAALAVVVATAGGVTYALHTRTQPDAASYPSLHAPVAVMCPAPTYSTTADGHPFTATHEIPLGIRPRNDCAPAFTQQDVRDYMAQGRLFLGARISVIGRPTVTRVLFLTVGDLGRATGNSVWEANCPADMPVCYGGLSGTFSSTSGLGPASSLSAAFIALDAHTGNTIRILEGAPLG
jgi:hypothetical protein